MTILKGPEFERVLAYPLPRYSRFEFLSNSISTSTLLVVPSGNSGEQLNPFAYTTDMVEVMPCHLPW